MDKGYFLKLLNKYQQGKTTGEEDQLIISYYNLFENNPDVMELLTSEQKEHLKHDIRDDIWSNILEKQEQ